MKDIRSFLANYAAASSGYSFGKLKNNPGDDTGSAVTVDLFNDFLYAFYAFIKKYGAVSDTDESETASDFVDAFMAVTVLLTGAQTIAGVKTFSSTIVGSIDSIKETGTGAGTLRKKIINIGDWNMDTTVSVNINHGLTLSKIRSLSVMIINDTADTIYSLITGTNISSGIANGAASIDATEVNLNRLTSGLFDSTSFDSTSFNRGWIVIEYID